MSEANCKDVRIDAEGLLKNEGGTENPVILEAAQWAASRAECLASPALTYRILPIERLAGGILEVGGVQLHVGPNASLLKNAREVLAAVATIGPALDGEIRRLQKAGNLLEAYLVGKAGFSALDTAASALYSVAEKTAAVRGWGVGAALSPGSLPGWPWEDQKKLCLLVDAQKAGVQISETGLLEPQYTISMIIGLGPGYESHSVVSGCNYCSLKNRCVYRPGS